MITRSVEWRKIISIIGIVIMALFTMVVIPIGSAVWNETLQINGNLNTGLFILTSPPPRPTFFLRQLTPSPSPTASQTVTSLPTRRATPTPSATDSTLETKTIIARSPTITPRPWPTQTVISPTWTKEPVDEPTVTATDVQKPSPRPTLALTGTVEIPPTLPAETPTDIPPIDSTPQSTMR